ncbi:TonB-dependent receptor domain-containing protein [Croceibacterium ferulae]|uniref:TonB-dependent receptor domain-containing protein n=1 Tax=Croceibacterium ferulae TaxID=1854641 RepID=UPI000EAD2F7E|nr:TonB-dependent receptor [Croceibacterium ferulae]
MTIGQQLSGLLLLTSALTAPAVAWAQGTTGDANAGIPGSVPVQQPPQTNGMPGQDEPAFEETDISAPGAGEIIVTGRVNRDPTRNSTQVLSVLSAEQIARTGEGDIAGALGRVTGLSVQGNGYVFVRGLGDRYSLAMLNGLPLPSPEPLSRVVPLDIFPTNVIASSLVQKTFSANYPGEFGGGVINLTTRAVPAESFLSIGGGISGNTETTGQVGYSYFGSDSDWTGFDDGSRDLPGSLQDFLGSGQQINEVDRPTQRTLLKDLSNANFTTLQRLNRLPVNFSGSITGGTSTDVFDGGRLGVIATASLNNSWRNRLISRDFAADQDLGVLSTSQNYTTDNRVLVNGLLGVGLEIAEHRFRWTNLFIRDTLKQSVLGIGQDLENTQDEVTQDTSWFERQLLDTQFVGEMEFGDLEVDVRAGYAQTQREAPFEYSFSYFRTPDSIYGDLYRNTLDGQRSDATVAFSDLTEDLYSAGLDLSYRLLDGVTATIGYAYSKTDRYSSRREFRFASSNLPAAFSLFNPANLLSDAIIDFGEDPANTTPYLLQLIENTQATPAFIAGLEVHGAYGQLLLQPLDGVTLDVGVRYETADQDVRPDTSVFTSGSIVDASTALSNDYFLPAATLTYEVGDGLQARVSASKTIARPQFRELIFQPYTDPETTRQYTGNPLLTDSTLINLEARLEYYIGGGSRATVAGFYKDIDRPIEAYNILADNRVRTSFANAPSAKLYGAEFELQYNHELIDLGGFFTNKEALVVANYTYTNSELSVKPGDQTAVFGSSVNDASLYFRDGAPMTGQSDHLLNLQLGIEDTEMLQQLTFLVNYASERVVSRSYNFQPDVLEDPGLSFDIVARQGFTVRGKEVQLKLEARNIFGEDHEEYLDNGENRIEFNTYDIGTTFAASVSVTL